MINVLIVDDEHSLFIEKKIVDCENSILNKRCNFHRFQFALKVPESKKEEYSDSEIAFHNLTKIPVIDIAILDIQFKGEYKSGEVNKPIISLIHKLDETHPNCQIIVMSKYRAHPNYTESFKLDGLTNRVFFAASKEFEEVGRSEYNLVFKKVLEKWRRSVLAGVKSFPDQLQIIQSMQKKSNCAILKREIDDFLFFSDDIDAILDCFIYIPEYQTSTSFYIIPPYDLFLKFYLDNYEEFISDQLCKVLADVFTRIIENDFTWAMNKPLFQNANVKKNIPEEKQEIYNKFHENNDFIRSLQKFPPYLYLVNKFNCEKDRFGNIDIETLQKFEKILLQRILYFFLFFVLHLKPNQIYNYLLNLSFEESTSEKYKQLPSQVLLIKGFDGRSLRKLDGKEDYRNKKIEKVLLQYTSYELEQMLKVFSQLIKLYNSNAIKNNSVAKVRLTQIISHIKAVLVEISPAV